MPRRRWPSVSPSAQGAHLSRFRTISSFSFFSPDLSLFRGDHPLPCFSLKCLCPLAAFDNLFRVMGFLCSECGGRGFVVPSMIFFFLPRFSGSSWNSLLAPLLLFLIKVWRFGVLSTSKVTAFFSPRAFPFPVLLFFSHSKITLLVR